MCGIAGVLSDEQVGEGIILSMTNSLCHRGPDAQDVFRTTNGMLAFGHTRLSIIDLSEKANQPMRSGSGRFTIVFNGEIYNYERLKKELQSLNPSIRFHTSSDTEIILAGFEHWGSSLCEKLDGMFAFAIWDDREQKLFLCRDRVGKKPLFYFQDDRSFIFASEIKSLMKHPAVKATRNVNKRALYKFLHLGFIPEPDTVFESIKKFPAAHYGWVSGGNPLQLNSYWNVRSFTGRKRINNQDDAFKAVQSTIENAVEKRLISDVPVGAFLSGGTDSSLVVAIASKLKKDRLKTFSIGFDDSRFDESVFARKVAQHLQTDHQEYLLHEREAVGILETYLKHFDEPFADTSAIPTMLVSSLAKKQVTVALTGDGGDELFLGYGAYTWADRLENPMMKLLQTPLSWGMRHWGNNQLKRISYLLEKVKAKERRAHIFSQEQYFFTKREIEEQLKFPMNGDLSHVFDYADLPTHISPSEQQALFDIQLYLKDDLLVKVDRASMYYGLECRCPLLDHELIELALAIPPQWKMFNNQRKGLLKELLKKHLPEELVNRPKWGFSIPMARWLKTDLRYLEEKFLSREMILQIGLVDYRYVEQLKKSFDRGDTFLYNRLWVLIALHKWMYENS